MRGWIVVVASCALGCVAPRVLVETDAGPDPLEAAYAKEADVICTQYAACMPSLFKYLFADRADCLAEMRDQRERITSGFGVTMTPAQRIACIDALTSCPAFERFDAMGVLPAPCRVPGLRADGDPCSWGRQCKSLFCSQIGDCGVCVSPKFENDVCGTGCGEGMRCVYDGMEWRCKKPGEIGQACGSTAPCMVDLVCRHSQCAPPSKEKDPCSDDEPCSQVVGTLSCNKTTGQCEHHRTAKLGEACGDQPDGSGVWCEHGAACSTTDLSSGLGVCVSGGKLGDACGGVYWQGPCVGTLRCIDARCQYPDEGRCLPPVVP